MRRAPFFGGRGKVSRVLIDGMIADLFADVKDARRRDGLQVPNADTARNIEYSFMFATAAFGVEVCQTLNTSEETPMSIREQVVWEVERLNEKELQSVAEYVSFLKYQADENRLSSLYREFEPEDRALAQDDIESYSQSLAQEDAA